jgi:AcrR family transcriptional regulator
MADAAAPPDTTRQALLDAAAPIFAEQGLQLARVRDIAASAGANLAAINYHFGGKEQLYVEVLRDQARRLIGRHPLPAAVPPEPSAVMREVVRSLLGRFLAADEHALLPRLLVREMLNPTPALDLMIDEVSRPQFAQLSGVVSGLLGPKAGPEQVRRAVFSLLAQCLFYLVAQPLVRRIAPQSYEPEEFERLVAHIATFSLAGLQAQRAQIEGGKSHA